MDWTGLGLQDRIVSWLETAADARYAKDRRLDPYATSMRDFDDASVHLKAIRIGNPPAIEDARQRIVDLSNANLVVSGGQALTELGVAVLAAWEMYGVDTDSQSDELARALLMALEARRIDHKDFVSFFEYWSDLRSHFDPLELINSWDSLYQINYLDFERDGFFPGTAYRDEKVAVSEIEFGLTDYAHNVGASAKAIEGGERIQKAIAGKLPRGRHRATFCMALEIVLSEGESTATMLANFGFPKKPGVWAPFNDEQKAKIEQILADYDPALVLPEEQHEPEAAGSDEAEAAPIIPKPEPILPNDIDFSTVLVSPPKPKKKAASTGGKSSGTKKVDYKQKADTNDAIGKLGEEFALAFERWRLRNHPHLLKNLRHVSKDDDTLGYDIESFELDGTSRLVEVKATTGPIETRFYLSANELACAETNGEQYVIFRIGQLTSDPRCCEIRFPYDGKLQLKPETYSVTFTEDDAAE